MGGVFKDSEPPGSDPAEIARQRSAEIADLLRQAEEAEQEARDSFEDPESGPVEEDVEHMSYTRANNLRLRALCKYLRLPAPNQSGTDEDEGRGGD